MRGVGEVGSTKVQQSLEILRSRKRQNKTGLELLGISAPKMHDVQPGLYILLNILPS